ncbi:MAG: hypothetical protein H0T46_00335 [Deltaproteobacteria bacterium]|nr:hypothetical protein [Deltaproteobacteria bacterium]
MLRPLRCAVLIVLAAGCGKKASEPPASVRFGPADPDTVLRIDVTRARAWSGWPRAAPLVFRAIQPSIDAVKSTCGFDLINDSSSILLARNGTGAQTNLTLSFGGLPGDKLSACPGKLGTAIAGLEVTADGTRFEIKRAGKGFASGAILPSGEVVIVSRNAANIEAAAWRSEVDKGGGEAPAWWAELEKTRPIAIRSKSAERTLTGDADLGDPFVLRMKIIAANEQVAQADHARAKAVIAFLTKAEAGIGRLEPKGLTIHGDFTATGPQIEQLLSAGLSALGGDQPEPAPPTATNKTPIECSALDGAVATYVATSLEKMPPEQKEVVVPTVAKLVSGLQKAYSDSCTSDKWSFEAINCHVDDAANIPRFEKCRLVLTTEQREHFDTLVKAALDASR